MLIYGVLMVFLFILSIVVIFGLGAIFGFVVLHPVIEATRGRRSKPRFYTADFFSLTFVLAIAGIYVSTILNSAAPSSFAIGIGILAFALAIWIWVRGAMKLSVIGVSSSLKRFVFQAVVVPLAVVGAAIGVPGLCLATIASVGESEPMRIALSVFGIVWAFVLVILGNKLCDWTIRCEGNSPSEQASEHEADLFSTANDELKDSALPFGD